MNRSLLKNEVLAIDLHGAYIRRVSLRGAILDHANLTGADCRGADFSSTRLKAAVLRNADFTDANFHAADFENADLNGAILKGADLTGAQNLTVQQLRVAVLDSATKLPAILADALRLG